ncbi:ArsR/SmtB family transcription factor [Streptomyces sp. x-80]|uniref:ArsR/SmtB family transcription factor n=1 Tax=Streptomyces sp. x-80 TaxID=2789282 RepID=UPI00397FCA25
MGLRIHFTGEDLARTSVATEADPLWDILLSLHMLQSPREGAAPFGAWRRRTAAGLPPRIRDLATLAPPRGYSPDFLTPASGAGGVEAGIDAVVSTPRRRLRAELGRLGQARPLSPWARDLAEGRADAMRQLAAALRTYHRLALAPYREHLRSQIAAGQATGIHALLHGGLGAFLNSLHPALRWHHPVLEVHGFPSPRDLFLNGRGLRLVPSFFCWRTPIALYDPALQPVLVYPVTRDPAWPADLSAGPAGPPAHALGDLLGRTRAAALEAIADGCTTGELARRLAVSPATASHHVGILRRSGLVTTRRTGGAVHHTLRPLGTELLLGRRTAARWRDGGPHEPSRVPPSARPDAPVYPGPQARTGHPGFRNPVASDAVAASPRTGPPGR